MTDYANTPYNFTKINAGKRRDRWTNGDDDLLPIASRSRGEVITKLVIFS